MAGVLEMLLDPERGLTLLAPAVAIVCALVTQRVVASLFAGAVVGAFVAHADAPLGAFGGFWGYARESVWDLDHLTISAFSLLVAGTVGILGASGATRALVRAVGRYAQGPRGAMAGSWAAGGVVFFDDYANCLVVGNAMGPLCDRYGVSRAKLAYIVDSTAAPVASLALVSTWVGYEVGLIGDALIKAGSDASAFSVFLGALPFRFYSIFALAFVGMIAWTNRDFGPMLRVERQARKMPVVLPAEQVVITARPWMAVLPIAVLLTVTFGWMIADGREALGAALATAPWFEVLGQADPYRAMFMGSAVSFVLAGVIVLGTRQLSLGQSARAAAKGMWMVAEALLVLYLAWTLGNAISDTGAAEFISSMLEGRLPPTLLPAVTFVLAGMTAFATGTSFGTMSILIPLAVPLALSVAPGNEAVLYASTASVLAGACLGDHASPISDTTVLSALGAGVDVVTHVRTQLPYALTVGLIAIVCGYLPVAFGVPVAMAILMGLLTCAVVIRVFGQRNDEAFEEPEPIGR